MKLPYDKEGVCARERESICAQIQLDNRAQMSKHYTYSFIFDTSTR